MDGILLLIILRESCLIILWSHATLFKVFYYQLYCGYIITGYTEGILFKILWSYATLPIVYCYWLYGWYIVTDYTEGILFNKIVITCYFTYGILLLMIPMVYYYRLYWGKSCLIRLWSRATLLIVYIVTDCTDGILLLIILRESCLTIFVIMYYFTHCILLLIVWMVYYYWLYWGNPV